MKEYSQDVITLHQQMQQMRNENIQSNEIINQNYREIEQRRLERNRLKSDVDQLKLENENLKQQLVGTVCHNNITLYGVAT